MPGALQCANLHLDFSRSGSYETWPYVVVWGLGLVLDRRDRFYLARCGGSTLFAHAQRGGARPLDI